MKPFADIFWQAEQPWVLGLVVAFTLLLHYLRPSDRYMLRQTLVFLVVCQVGLGAAAIIQLLEFAPVASGVREAAVVGTGIAVIRLTGMTMFRVVLPAMSVVVPRIIEDILVIIAYFMWGALRLRMGGMELSGIVATSALLTAVIGFAMQDTLGNLLAGLAVQLDHSVEIGDWVKIDDLSGKVADIRWRYTKVVTRNGETLVVPNSVLMKGKFLVLGAHGDAVRKIRRWVWFNVDLSAAPARVIALAEQAVRDAEIAGVSREPAANCVLMDFGPGYARFAMRYWLLDIQRDDPTDSAVRTHVLAALQRAGMRIALPAETRHMIEENKKHAAVVEAREMERRLAALRSVAMFSLLSEQELTAVASHLRPAPFDAGDVITRQDAVAHWLYLLIDGKADIWVQPPSGPKTLLTTLEAGSVFGEMGMMTGEPRQATVIAKTYVECFRLDKAGFEDVIRSRPEIADGLAHILAERRHQLDQTRSDLKAQSDEQALARSHQDILGRIRRFFSLEAKA
jgi:small-conductance mechanosensitive channel/CRP-like cAMP-binding protein